LYPVRQAPSQQWLKRINYLRILKTGTKDEFYYVASQ